MSELCDLCKGEGTIDLHHTGVDCPVCHGTGIKSKVKIEDTKMHETSFKHKYKKGHVVRIRTKTDEHSELIHFGEITNVHWELASSIVSYSVSGYALEFPEDNVIGLYKRVSQREDKEPA